MRTVEEVRRLRLEQVRTVYKTWAALNTALGLDPRDSTFSQIMSDKTKKDMGSDLARRLERLLDKDTGWMDTDPAFDDQRWPFGEDIVPASIADLPADLLLEARGMLKTLLAQAQRAREATVTTAAEPPKPDYAAQRTNVSRSFKPKADVPAQTQPAAVRRGS